MTVAGQLCFYLCMKPIYGALLFAVCGFYDRPASQPVVFFICLEQRQVSVLCLVTITGVFALLKISHIMKVLRLEIETR